MVVLRERLDLRALPKAELHLHLEATIAADTARELAARAGLPVPPAGPFGGQAEFVRAYEGARDLVRSLDDVRRLAAELASRQAADGVLWSEVHLAPSTYAGRLGPADGLVEAFLDGAGHGGAGGRLGLVLGINRGLPVAEAVATVDLALRWAGRGVVALGIAGDEAAHPLEPFAPVFARARAAGLPAVPHCGEGTGPAGVRSALALHPQRLCHGLGAAGEDGLLDELAARGICLDMAPSSNVALGLVPSLAEHPLPGLLRRGLEVTVSTDIPGFLGHGLVEELELCRRAWGLDDGELARLAATSLRRSSVPLDDRILRKS
ncbi:adenosine deaminase family protein [Nocardioides sp. MAHUQ-72]|uniref:adenosine deaminase family protein n=1 Tax=unclassified Nocardioides TaxID=2615069 RepID=UPI0036223A27